MSPTTNARRRPNPARISAVVMRPPAVARGRAGWRDARLAECRFRATDRQAPDRSGTTGPGRYLRPPALGDSQTRPEFPPWSCALQQPPEGRQGGAMLAAEIEAFAAIR